jgi:hypothetical protein
MKNKFSPTEKMKLMKIVSEAFDSGGLLIVFAEGYNQDVVIAIEGPKLKLVTFLAACMERDPEISQLMDTALAMTRVRRDVENPLDTSEIDKLLASHLDCKSCEKRDTCEIVDQVEAIRMEKEWKDNGKPEC